MPIPVQWCSLDDLKRAPVRGVVLAHELLDALPVERLIWSGGKLNRQGVKLLESADAAPALTCVSMPLSDDLHAEVLGMAEACGFNLPRWMPLTGGRRNGTAKPFVASTRWPAASAMEWCW